MASNLPGKTEASLGQLSQLGQGSDHYYLRGKEISSTLPSASSPFPLPSSTREKKKERMLLANILCPTSHFLQTQFIRSRVHKLIY